MELYLSGRQQYWLGISDSCTGPAQWVNVPVEVLASRCNHYLDLVPYPMSDEVGTQMLRALLRRITELPEYEQWEIDVSLNYYHKDVKHVEPKGD